MNERIISQEGLNQLKRELQGLQTVTRPEMVQRIEAAKALGDLSENAEYHDAKDQLQIIDTRISEITDLLNTVVVAEKNKDSSDVGLGSTVEVEVSGKAKSFQIVGASEAEPLSGKISNESPIGKALFGHRAGDAVEVHTPSGVAVFKIMNVR